MTPDDDSMWMIDGLCRQIGGDAWFPDSLDMQTQTASTEAKTTCKRCPVQEKCLTWALAGGERFGIWGGINFGTARASMLRELRTKYGIDYTPRRFDALHGTEAGYKRHTRLKEQPCRPCAEAGRIARVIRRQDAS